MKQVHFLSAIAGLAGAASVAVLAGATATACTSFGAEPAPDAGEGGLSTETGADAAVSPDASPVVCPVESCGDAGPSCRFIDFAAGCPAPPDFTFTGDKPGVAGVVGECQGGKLHVAASNKMGVEAVLEVMTPGALDAIHISAQIAVKTWDQGPVVTVSLAGVAVARINAVGRPSGNPAFVLCGADGQCNTDIFEPSIGATHTFTLDLTNGAVSLAIDCKPFSQRSSNHVLAPNALLGFSFGKTSAIGIDGTLDELLISYR